MSLTSMFSFASSAATIGNSWSVVTHPLMDGTVMVTFFGACPLDQAGIPMARMSPIANSNTPVFFIPYPLLDFHKPVQQRCTFRPKRGRCPASFPGHPTRRRPAVRRESVK
jgi:hypothetical protein